MLGSRRKFAVTAALPPNIASFRFQPLHPTPLALMPLLPRPWWRNRVEIKSRNMVLPSDAGNEAENGEHKNGRRRWHEEHEEYGGNDGDDGAMAGGLVD